MHAYIHATSVATTLACRSLYELDDPYLLLNSSIAQLNQHIAVVGVVDRHGQWKSTINFVAFVILVKCLKALVLLFLMYWQLDNLLRCLYNLRFSNFLAISCRQQQMDKPIILPLENTCGVTALNVYIECVINIWNDLQSSAWDC